MDAAAHLHRSLFCKQQQQQQQCGQSHLFGKARFRFRSSSHHWQTVASAWSVRGERYANEMRNCRIVDPSAHLTPITVFPVQGHHRGSTSSTWITRDQVWWSTFLVVQTQVQASFYSNSPTRALKVLSLITSKCSCGFCYILHPRAVDWMQVQ